MTKKPLFWIIVVLLAALIIAAVIWGKQYYENRYVGSDYFAMVPLDFDVTPETMYSMDGKEVGLGKKYSLTAYNEQGESKTVGFSVNSEDSTNYPQPGTYLRISASKQIVVGWSVINESSIPEKALNMIKERVGIE
jgi:uncharacterized protein (TIGR01655 family)